MKYFVLILLSVMFVPYGIAQQSESVQLETEKGILHGTLLVPDPEGMVPVVLIIAGSGPTDRDGNNLQMVNNSLKMLAEGLAESGIASLRYDKRGVGESSGAAIAEVDLRFTDYVNDASAWTSLLRKDKRFDRVFLLGHSMGALIGTLVAQEKDVDGFISLAGAGVTGAELLRTQLRAQPPFVLEQAEPVLDSLVLGLQVKKPPPLLFALFRPSIQPYLISWFQYDPKVEISKLEIPVLIVQGTTDIQISVTDAEKLAEGYPAAQKHIVEQMNHVLKVADSNRLLNVQTYGNPDLPLSPELMPTLIQFINK